MLTVELFQPALCAGLISDESISSPQFYAKLPAPNPYFFSRFQLIMSLTAAQAKHVASVPPEYRLEMSQFLLAGAEVVIYEQNESGSDDLPFAIAVTGTAFWIDCCETLEKAIAHSESLGLKLLDMRNRLTTTSI